jgi:uncharacterized protein YjbK
MLLVCYSHSEYSDILQVQSDFLQAIPYQKVVLLDKPTQLPFTKTILYDDTLKFTKKVYTTVSQLEDEYILFYHDNDIILQMNTTDIEKMLTIMKEQNIDRIDLKHYSADTKGIVVGQTYEINPNISICLYDKSSRYDFTYNVQPSLWKRSALLDIMNKFDCTYREIEFFVQDYCRETKNMAFLFTQTPIPSGYTIITPSYVYLHITFHGHLMPVNPLSDLIKNNGMNIQLLDIYKMIISTYSFNRRMHA